MASAVLLAYPSVTPASTLQSFDVVNFDGVSSSDGFIRVGLPFKYGDVSTGNIPKIEKSGVEITAVQFDERTFWPDGSLRYCVLHMRDSTFSASESRTYDVKTKSGSYSNTATFATSAITGTYDLKTQITSLTQPNQSNTNNHTASLNTAFGTATRVTKIHSGPICDGWMVWQYYNDDSDSIDDTHLKAVWYVDIWNDGSDTDQGYIEFGCKTCLNNWDTANKDRHDYTLTLKNSTTTIETYSTIQHPYHAEWLTVSKGNDNNDGRRHWLSTAPTLYVKPDQAYWISTGLIPPYDTSLSTASATDYNTAWAPLDNIDHRADIDGTGSYQGRGILPNSDVTAFLSQTAAHTRYARVNAHAGLHIGYHYRSTDNRNRSSKATDAWNDFSVESADEANTITSFILEPLSAGAYDFTGDGMPAAVHAYRGGSTTYKDGYTSYTGGDGVWNLSEDASHGVNFSYFMYLLEGERYFMEAAVDVMQSACWQRSNGNSFQGRPYLVYYLDTYRATQQSIPSTRYGAIGVSGTSPSPRSFGWAAGLMGSVYAIVPDNDVIADYVRTAIENNMECAATSISYLPTKQASWGVYFEKGTGFSAWQQGFISLGATHLYNCSRHSDAQTFANHAAKFPLNLWTQQSGRNYDTKPYRGSILPKREAWHATNNDFRAITDYFTSMSDNSLASTDASTDYISIAGEMASGDLANGDKVTFMALRDGGDAAPIPGGVDEATDYYVINKTGLTFQISTTPGGSAVDITTSETGCQLHCQRASAVATVAANPPYLPPADSYSPILRAALIGAYKAGLASITSGNCDVADTFLADVDNSSWYTWSYAQ